MLPNCTIFQCIILCIFKILPSRCLTVFIPFRGLGVEAVEVLGIEVAFDDGLFTSSFGLIFFRRYCLLGA
jgi:hypothetical protein